MQSWGVPKEPIQSMFSTLQQIQYKTRTAYGDSNKTFGGVDTRFTSKPQGAGQGNGAAPPTWVVVSSKMFEILKKKGLSNHIYTPVTKEKLDLAGFAYVDDSDLFVLSTTENPETTKEKMQELLDAWEEASKVTGGALEPKKCWWYLLNYEWHKGMWIYKGKRAEQKLVVRDAQENLQEILQMEAHESQEMLGVYLAPDGNQLQQLQEFEKRAMTYAEKARTANLHRHEVWISLQTMVMKSIEYPLSVTTLNEKECNDLMWKLIKEFLPKAGINRYVRRDILFAPVQCQGFGLNDPYITQGAMHVSDIIEHLWKKTVTGHFIRTILEYMRLEIGSNISILESDYYKYDDILLTKTWVQSTWQFMSDKKVTINDSTKTIKPERERDTAIMDHIYKHTELSSKERKTFNKCRIYLKVFLISEICTGDGQYILENIWTGQRDETIESKYNWPIWDKPSNKDWKTWQKVLCKTICNASTQKLENANAKQKLQQSLGVWRQVPQNHKWFLDKEQSLVERCTPKQFKSHKIIKGRTRNKHYQINAEEINTQAILQLEPTTIQKHDKFITTEGSASIIHKESTANKHNKDNEMNESITKKGDEQSLIQELLTGKVVGVSDGSCYQDKRIGAAAWILTTQCQQHHIIGTTVTPGREDNYNSF